jgi:hypothetical protein
MENLQHGLVSFLASFISSRITQTELTESLIRKMLKLKPVQKIIIDSMIKLEPIINNEILAINNLKTTPSQRSIQRKSKLLMLADEVKSVMNNYEYIQGQLSSMKTIVENLDLTLDTPQNSKNAEIDPSPGLAFSYLSTIDKIKPINNQEIHDISDDI